MAPTRLATFGAIALLLTTTLAAHAYDLAQPAICQKANMNSAATTTDGVNCREPSGGPPPPPPPSMFNGVLDTTWITDYTNPLDRFQTLSVPSDGNGDLVVGLPAWPYTADPGDSQATVVSVTDSDVATSVAAFGLSQTTMAAKVREILSGDTRYAAIAATASSDIEHGNYQHARSTLMAQPTPADVRFWCGPDGNPAYVDWVLVIPVAFTCSVGTTPVSVVAVATPGGVQFVQDALTPGKRISALDLNYTATSSTTDGSTRVAIGYSYGELGVGARTPLAKTWSTLSRVSNLDHNRPVASTTWKFGLPTDVLSGTALRQGDSAVFTYRGKLTRGPSAMPVLARDVASHTEELRVEQYAGPAQWALRAQPAIPADVKFFDVRASYPDGHGIAGRVATPPLGIFEISSDVTPNAAATGYVIGFARQDGLQPENLPQDQTEIGLSFYAGSAAKFTVQTLALPQEALFSFEDGSSLLDPILRMDVSADLNGASTPGFYRTVLATSHNADYDYSETGDYVRRASLWAGPSPDPLNATSLQPWVVTGAYVDDMANWERFHVARPAASDGASFTNTTFAWVTKQQLMGQTVKVGKPESAKATINPNAPVLFIASPQAGKDRVIWLTQDLTSCPILAGAVCR